LISDWFEIKRNAVQISRNKKTILYRDKVHNYGCQLDVLDCALWVRMVFLPRLRSLFSRRFAFVSFDLTLEKHLTVRFGRAN
jgi:hypothetical protein